MQINQKTDALLLVDLQPDFMPGGALPVTEGDQILTPISKCISLFDVVVATQDWHPKGHISFASRHQAQPFALQEIHGQKETLWPDHCIQGTQGALLHPLLPLQGIRMILRKGTHVDTDSYSAFLENRGPDGLQHSTGLSSFLQELGTKRVFVCGLARDFCVRFSALDAIAAGFDTLVIEDLTRSVYTNEESVNQITKEFRKHGIASIVSSDIIS